MAFQASAQQQALFDHVDGTDDNVFLDAGAGCGKTTTLVELCKRLKGSVVFVAFNKAIVVEITNRTAGMTHVTAATFHSLGYQAMRNVFKFLKVDPRAKQDAVKAEIGLPDRFASFVFAAVSQAKNRAMFEDQIGNTELWYDIVEHFDLAEMIEDQTELPEAIEYAQKALRASIKLVSKVIDFDDQLYIPVIKGYKLRKFDYVLVDEAQDTNPVRRAFARMLMAD